MASLNRVGQGLQHVGAHLRARRSKPPNQKPSPCRYRQEVHTVDDNKSGEDLTAKFARRGSLFS
jgi:hypothetical protein